MELVSRPLLFGTRALFVSCFFFGFPDISSLGISFPGIRCQKLRVIVFEVFFEISVTQFRPCQLSCESGVAVGVVLRDIQLCECKLSSIILAEFMVFHVLAQEWLHKFVDMGVFV